MQEFKKCFHQFYEQAQTCVTSQGDCFQEYLTICFDFKVVFLKFMQSWNLIVQPYKVILKDELANTTPVRDYIK
jgi:hypothetical protein